MIDNGAMSISVRRQVARALLCLLTLALALLGPAAPARAATANDPGFPLQWGLEMIGAPAAWEVGTGAGTTIAVVDSGVARAHEDLIDRLVGTVSCLGTGGLPDLCTSDGAAAGLDDAGHGTHVSGIAVATRNNGVGVAGVAPDARLLAIKALRAECAGEVCKTVGNALDVTAAIRYAANAGATVINLSVDGVAQSLSGTSFADAVRYASSKGSVVVVAAGNDNAVADAFTDLPAIVVTAVDRGGDRPAYANNVSKARWGLAAPGGAEAADTAESCETAPQGILSTYGTGDQTTSYACLPGTSAAAAFVSGAVAVLRSTGVSPQVTVQRLLDTARPGNDLGLGKGIVDLPRALVGGAPSSTTTTRPSPTTVPSTTDPDPSPSTTEQAVPPVTTPVPPPPPEEQPAPQDDVPPAVDEPAEIDLTHPTSSIGIEERADLPGGPVVVAALLAVLVGGASGWTLLRNADWARRTPLR